MQFALSPSLPRRRAVMFVSASRDRVYRMVVVGGLMLGAGACDAGAADAPLPVHQRSGGHAEVSGSRAEKSASRMPLDPAELVELREKVGFANPDELVARYAERAAADAKTYLREHSEDYLQWLDALDAQLRSVEKALRGWNGSRAAQRSFTHFAKYYDKRTRALVQSYNRLTAHGAEGGEYQRELGELFAEWELLRRSLGPHAAQDTSVQERCAKMRGQVRRLEREVKKIARTRGPLATPTSKLPPVYQ